MPVVTLLHLHMMNIVYSQHGVNISASLADHMGDCILHVLRAAQTHSNVSLRHSRSAQNLRWEAS